MIQSTNAGWMRPKTLWMRAALPVDISIRIRRPRRVAPTERSASKLPRWAPRRMQPRPSATAASNVCSPPTATSNTSVRPASSSTRSWIAVAKVWMWR